MKRCVKCAVEFTPIANNQRRCHDCRHLTCANCGKRWIPSNSAANLKCCSRECADVYYLQQRIEQAKAMGPGKGVKPGPTHPDWKGDEAQAETKRARCRRKYRNLGDCERCGKPAVHRHHKDENTGNNDRSNIEFLCAKCHARHHHCKPPRSCSHCGKSINRSRKGLCNTCYEYKRRYGCLLAERRGIYGRS